ncbi:MAG: EscN/YscN/HrcN family type III secretion system ATPase, partial [Rhodospirillaceae bacterium]|nr:EscN/YscN/HrcN family type III secretion system ATPase [Rhodospirillaceae bacterium]
MRTAPLTEKRGRVLGVTGALIRATVGGVRIGDLCHLQRGGRRATGEETLAEVVGFDDQHVLLSPLGTTIGISNDTQVAATGARHEVPVGPALLGKVLNG